MKTYDFARLQARPFPTVADLKNPYIFGKTGVVINVSEREWPSPLRELFPRQGWQLFWYPLYETGLDMGLENILECVRILEKADAEGIPAIVHCDFGNNRSRVVAEAFHFRKMGYHLEDPYKGAKNHLLYNCSIGLLPTADVVESLLVAMRESRA